MTIFFLFLRPKFQNKTKKCFKYPINGPIIKTVLNEQTFENALQPRDINSFEHFLFNMLTELRKILLQDFMFLL